MLVIHGGGWRAGERAAHDDLTWQFAQRGYVCATVDYRLCPRYRFPAQVEDVKFAVRFLRANSATCGTDPARVGVIGFSAGGQLAMTLGAMTDGDGLDDSGGWREQSSHVQAVVSYFGPTDLMAEYPPVCDKLLKDFIGGTRAAKPDAYRKASPVTYLKAGSAPMLLFQGTDDPLVPYPQACTMLQVMRKAGVAGRIGLLNGAGHGWDGSEMARSMEAAFDFFDEYLAARHEPAN